MNYTVGISSLDDEALVAPELNRLGLRIQLDILFMQGNSLQYLANLFAKGSTKLDQTTLFEALRDRVAVLVDDGILLVRSSEQNLLGQNPFNKMSGKEFQALWPSLLRLNQPCST